MASNGWVIYYCSRNYKKSPIYLLNLLVSSFFVAAACISVTYWRPIHTEQFDVKIHWRANFKDKILVTKCLWWRMKLFTRMIDISILVLCRAYSVFRGWRETTRSQVRSRTGMLRLLNGIRYFITWYKQKRIKELNN